MSAEHTVLPPPRRIIRRPEVERRTGFKRAHLYALMRQNLFPRNVPIGKRAVGWVEAEVDQWISTRTEKRSPAPSA